ncbi:transmembrane protein 151B-like [Ornithodoros turicata]|uniref:transmembrane protein 151B-like n=1 Tax=Ornithodoros turicata TaxID=34597 RepID=UPI0031389510
MCGAPTSATTGRRHEHSSMALTTGATRPWSCVLTVVASGKEYSVRFTMAILGNGMNSSSPYCWRVRQATHNAAWRSRASRDAAEPVCRRDSGADSACGNGFLPEYMHPATTIGEDGSEDGNRGWSANEDDAGQIQEPKKQSFLQSLRRNLHAKCLALTALMGGCLAAVAWCRLSQVKRYVINYHSIPMRSETRVSPCDDGYMYVPIALLFMLYLVYLVECWHCSTRLQLVYKVDSSAVYDHIEQMREAQPIIWWKAVCYHYVRRSRQVTRYRNGDTYTSTQVYYERINTHAAGSCFVYNQCGVRDISKKLVGLETHPTTKIRFSKGFAFANLEAAQEFEEQRARFFRENERLDDYMEMREGLDLVGANFQEYMVAFADRLPWYVSHPVFWLFSALLLSWPLRILVEFKTAYVHYQVTKLFGTNMSAASDAVSPTTVGRLSRGSTVDSAELEQSITDNFTLAPSYSEAVLMDASRRTDPNGNIPICIAVDGRHRRSWTGPSASSAPHVLYYVPPLSPDDAPVVSRHSMWRSVDECNGPPSYDEVVLPPSSNANVSAVPMPLRLFLRRSMTDRDLSRFLPGNRARETPL